MKCFYHKSDFDGICAGAIVKFFYPDCEMFGVDYSDKLDFTDIPPGERVYVVDFSFKRRDMIHLNELADLVWLDHHQSAIDKMSGYQSAIQGIRQVGAAGCELTWQFLSSRPAPTAVRLLGRYDVWDHSDPATLPFQYGMRTFANMSPEHEVWKILLDNPDQHTLISVVRSGRLILDYEEVQNTMYAKGMFHELWFHGHWAIAMNKAFANSKAFDAVRDPKKHEIMIMYSVKPGEWKYSLYSDGDVDVSKIAEQYGGGGHAKAAGFYAEESVF